MADENKPSEEENDNQEQKPAPGSFPLKPAGEVVVKHLDSPPPAGQRPIHPRRPAPPVPTREEREANESEKPKDSEE
ncbi:MAG TPA: hypothetical protein VFI72_13270 [Candidatus Angelobacter sp.]|nr:hypothetical protein [Candidatus Angelobacter sp.]